MSIFFSKEKVDVTEVKKPLEIWFNGNEGTLTSNGNKLEESMEIVLWGLQRGIGYKSSFHKKLDNALEQIVIQIYFTPLTGKMAGLPCYMLVSGKACKQLEEATIIAQKNYPMHEYSCVVSVIPFGSYNKYSLTFEFKHIEEITPQIEEVQKWLNFVEENDVDVNIALPDTLKPLTQIAPAKD